MSLLSRLPRTRKEPSVPIYDSPAVERSVLAALPGDLAAENRRLRDENRMLADRLAQFTEASIAADWTTTPPAWSARPTTDHTPLGYKRAHDQERTA